MTNHKINREMIKSRQKLQALRQQRTSSIDGVFSAEITKLNLLLDAAPPAKRGVIKRLLAKYKMRCPDLARNKRWLH